MPNKSEYLNLYDYDVALYNWMMSMSDEDRNDSLTSSTQRNITTRGLAAAEALGEGLVRHNPEHPLMVVRSGPFTFSSASLEAATEALRPQGSKKGGLKKEDLRERHLSKAERDMYHKPKSDWCESPRGEVCKSACTLDVSDLLVKLKK